MPKISVFSRRALGRGSRRPWRAAVGAILAVAFSVFPAFNAVAAKVPACSGLTPPSPCRIEDATVNWFWASNTKVTLCVPPPEGAPSQVPGVCGPVSLSEGVFSNAAGVASPISPGHIAVSMKAGQPDMRSYVKFDTGAIPPDSRFSSFVVTLMVSRSTQEHIERHNETRSDVPATANQEAAKIRACAVMQPLTAMKVDGGDPPVNRRVNQDEIDPTSLDPNASITSTTTEPTVDCGLSTEGERAPDGSKWTFDLTRIANAWASGDLFNEGVALIPQPSGVADTYTVEFHGASLTVREPTAGLPLPVPVPGLPEPPDPTPESDELEYVSEKEEAFAIVAFEPAPVDEVVVPPVTPPVAPPPPVIPDFGTPVPPVAPPPAAPPAQVLVPAGVTSGPNPGFWWLMIPIGALGFGLYSSAIGPAGAVATRAGNRVASVLRGRRLEGIEGVVGASE